MIPPCQGGTLTTVAKSFVVADDGSGDSLTREYDLSQTPPSETSYPCPRCDKPTTAAFYAPCGACLGELRAAAQPAPVRPLVTGITAKRRHWSHKPRAVLFAPVLPGDGWDDAGRRVTVGANLVASAAAYQTVYVCGAGAGHTVRALFSSTTAGWHRAALHDSDTNPSVTFQRDDNDESVRIMACSAWAGSEAVTAAAMAEAWRWCAERVGGFNGGGMLATPSTTGRDLMARLLPVGAELPTITTELADEIRGSSTQHRMELVTPGAEVDWFTEMDMRLAYAAVVRSLPVGVPVRMKGEPDQYEPHRAARYLATWTVPDDWTMPGLLPSQTGNGYEWDRRPGMNGGGWLDGSELRLARLNGWVVEVSESVLWPTKAACDPLRTWHDKLTALYREAECRAGISDDATAIAKRMVRAIIIHAIGSLRGNPTPETNLCAAEDAERLVPEDAEWWPTADGTVTWVTRREPAWEEWVRPEWTAAVWARNRCRLLDGPGAKVGKKPAMATGALHLPRGVQLIGFRGDALYLTGDPGWRDDGAAGRYRVKAEMAGPLTIPATLQQLDVMRGRGPARAHRESINAAKAALRKGSK